MAREIIAAVPSAKKERVQKVISQAAGDTAKAREQFDLYLAAARGHGQYIERAKKYDNFYLGGERQWDEKDRKALDAQGKPALTINQCMPIVNVVLGEQATRRADVKFKPIKDATADDAAMMGRVYQHVLDNNNYDWVESQVFADGVIQERGFFDIRMAFDENLFGHITITAEDPCDIIIDGDAKEYDPRTWSEVYKIRWASLDYIEETYGVDKRRLLETLVSEGRTRGGESIRFQTSPVNRFAEEHDDSTDMTWAMPGLTTPEKRRVRVVRTIERQFRKLHWQWYFVDLRTGDKSAVPASWPEEKIMATADKAGLGVHRVREQRIRWRVTADNVLLHDDWSPYRSFTIVPFFPYFRRGKTAGVMTNLISPQEMLNKISSQVVHVVNTTANSGWKVEANSLHNMTVADLERKGAQTGLVLEYKQGYQAPEKIMPNQIPTGLERISMNAQANMREISGVTDALLGLESAEVSGVALDSKERRGQVQLQVPMDNLARTRHMVTHKVVELIQEYMTEERLLTIVHERPRPDQPETEQMAINQPMPDGTILNDLSRGKYKWVLGSQPARDTFNDSQFAEAMALRNADVAIPDDRIIEYSNLENKMELAEEIRQLQGRGALSPEQQQMQQMMQQFEIMGMQLELQEMEAKVAKLYAEAQLAAAKAGVVPVEMEQKIQKAEQELAVAREGFELRKQLSAEQSTNNLEKIVAQHRATQVQKLTDARLQPFTRSTSQQE
jgi:hypothetical protein